MKESDNRVYQVTYLNDKTLKESDKHAYIKLHIFKRQNVERECPQNTGFPSGADDR